MIKCLLCKKTSLLFICQACQKRLLKPTLTTRILRDDFKVFSFYNYHEIAPLVKTKHTYIGAIVYQILAKNSFKMFTENFSYPYPVAALAVDDHIGSGYAHTAILAKALKSKHITPVFGALRASQDVSYAGKSLAFRERHPRGFVFSHTLQESCIIVDDIITTGTTILEAKRAIEKTASVPLFALTLADTRHY